MTHRGLAILTAAAGLFFGCAEGECQDGTRTYQHGQHWTCSDGCNSCSCNDDGTINTTAVGCAGPPGPEAGKLMCFEGGHWHRHGENWAGQDGCDLTCDDGRQVRGCD